VVVRPTSNLQWALHWFYAHFSEHELGSGGGDLWQLHWGNGSFFHARVAAVLEQDFADLVERQPELLAHHLTAAGDTARAVDQWLKAGQYAAERSAHVEAISHFERGLAALSESPEGATQEGRELELQLARGPSQFTVKVCSSVQAIEAYTRAHELAEQTGDARRLFMAVYGLWQSAAGSGRLLAGHRLSDRLLDLTAGTTDDGLRLQAHHSAWTTYVRAGSRARALRGGASALWSRSASLPPPALWRPRSRRVRCIIAAQAYWLLGYPEKGLAIGKEALALAKRIAHPFSVQNSPA
jgi:hypothetical protein